MGKCKADGCTQALTKTSDKGCDWCAVHCEDGTCDADLHKAHKKALQEKSTVCPRTRMWIMANLSPATDWTCDCGKDLWGHPKGSASAGDSSDPSPASAAAALPSPEAAAASAAAAQAAADGLAKVASAIEKQTAAASAAAAAASKSAGAGSAAGVTYGAKEWRVTAVVFRAHHPAGWTQRGNALTDLLGRVSGASTWDLKLERRLDERDAARRGAANRSRGAAKASGAWNPDEDDSLRVLYDDCKLDKAGLSHMRTLRDAAGIVAVVAELSRSANDGHPILIPKGALRRGAKGSMSAQLFLGELVTAFFVQLGLNEIEVWFTELDEKHRADATFYVRFSPTKNRKYGMRWTQRSVRVWLGMYRAFLRSRSATYTNPNSHAVAMAEMVPAPVRDSKEEHDHTTFLFWLGLVVAVRTSERNAMSSSSDDDADGDDSPSGPQHHYGGAAGAGAASADGFGGCSSAEAASAAGIDLGGSKPAKIDADAVYDALKASWTGWNLAFHKEIVMDSANVNEAKLLPRDAVDTIRGKPRGGGAAAADGAGAAASGDGGGRGSGNGRGTRKRGGGRGGGGTVLGKDTAGDRRDPATGPDRPPANWKSGPFKACMWVDPAGESCQRTPPQLVAKFGSRDPLCAPHRSTFNGLSDPDKATALANVKARHPSVTKLTRD